MTHVWWWRTRLPDRKGQAWTWDTYDALSDPSDALSDPSDSQAEAFQLATALASRYAIRKL